MHGRKRLPIGHTPDLKKDKIKRDKLEGLISETLSNHHNRCYTKDALKESAKLLELSPEVYTAWNYRKLAVRHQYDLETDDSARRSLLDEELQLVERALQANVKSYGAWYHRKWVISFGLSSLDHELKLLKKLLKADSRNFHGWDYRRFIVETKGMAADEELEYATEKINENFSNYSAWHYRSGVRLEAGCSLQACELINSVGLCSTLLSRLIKDKKDKAEVLGEEYELVNQAYFTDPQDQSAWFYNTWLLGETKAEREGGTFVTGSWPEDGSSISVRLQTEESSLLVTYNGLLQSEQTLSSPTFPVVLIFSEPVVELVTSISSEPVVESWSETILRPLCGLQEPSKIWVAELQISSSVEREYSVTLQASASSADDMKYGHVSFRLQVKPCAMVENQAGLCEKPQLRQDSFTWPDRETSTGLSEAQAAVELQHLGLQETCADPESPGGALTAKRAEGWPKRMLGDQIDNLRELLKLEQESKWPLLILARVLLAYSTSRFTDEVLKLYQLLPNVDSNHHEYYKAQYSTLLLDKITRNPGVLQKLCSNLANGLGGWLRLNGLALNGVRQLDRLVWVQRLDLSHNSLRNLDGLEMLQLLEALDVSYNRLPSVTSLAPLSLTPRLRHLNISYNELGSHPVDTTRYSVASNLTNKVSSRKSTIGEEFSFSSHGSWEVFNIFGGMVLKSLVITGNVAASDENFMKLLVKSLPSLETLNLETVKQW